MLMTTRTKGESIKIGNITIVVLSVNEHTVRLGIEAPPDVPIVRMELMERSINKQERTK